MKKTLLALTVLLSVSIYGQESYYSGLDFSKSGVALKQDLATKINSTHTNFLTYTPGVWEASKITDVNPNNSAEVLLIYGFSASGKESRTRGINDNGGNQGDWNREHTYPRSLGNPNLEFVGPGADAHHLRPSDVGYNGERGNKKFATGSGNSGSVSGGWYPGDEWKGDVARMMMYMYTRYGDQCLPTVVGVGSNANTPDDMIDLFLKWNVEDPVSDFERQRNTYHSNTANTYAQGNRNPFIDNAYLATRIWGGDAAVDSWGIFVTSDSEAPSIPTNVSVSNISTSSFDVAWSASTDNEAVSGYEILLNGTKNGESTTTSYKAENLVPNTNYSVTIIAKDVANNKSANSTAFNTKTLADTTAPSTPSNIVISNQTGSSFQVTWDASTDNSGILKYEIYLDGTLNGTSTNTTYNATNLATSTTYAVTVLAEDKANLKSSLSGSVSAVTTDGSNNISEIFFSEYVEGSGFNKAIEIVNLTSNNVDLSPYSIKRQSGGVWETPLQLSGTLNINNVYVIINGSTTDPKLIAEKDVEVANVTPMTFNGDDRVGLFKNDVLIDIIGDLDGTTDFGQNITLRRNSDVKGPTTDYNEQKEWSFFASNTVSDIGNFNGTLDITKNIFSQLNIYPNPLKGDTLFLTKTDSFSVEIYNLIGKKVLSKKVVNSNKVDVSSLKNGLYIVRFSQDDKTLTQKFIKQ
ncbi:MAG: endonuclease [Polaribacter sp.]